MRALTLTPPSTAPEFDAAMRDAFSEPSVVTLASGHYKTAGINPWNRGGAPRGFIVDGTLDMQGDVTIELDGASIPDSAVNGEPVIALKGRGVWDTLPPDQFAALTPQEIWDRLPREAEVRGGTVICNHSKLVDRWNGLGFALRTSAVQLHGHGPLVSGVKVLDAGAYRHNPAEGAETFPIVCSGVDGSADSTPLAHLDPATHIFDADTRAAAIVGCTFDGYVPNASNDQVTCMMIVGMAGEAAGWNKGDWRYLWRRDYLIDHNTVRASGANLVQGYTAYQAHGGRCTYNVTEGADIGVYGDFFQSENSDIEFNQFSRCRHGVAFYLSPVPRPLSDTFYQRGHKIGLNKIDSNAANVSLITFNDEWQKLAPELPVARTPRRIDSIGVHSSLSVEALQGAEYYVIDPIAAQRGGCLRRFGL